MHFLFVFTLLFPSALTSSPDPPRAELILYHGTVVTLGAKQPGGTALAIQGGKILAVGEEKAIRTLAGPDTRFFDMGGGVAYPGFADAHGHVAGLGASTRILDLTAASSEEQAAELVRQAAGHTPKGSWIQGRGWDQNRWTKKTFPSRASLDEAAPDHPVLLIRVDGHAAWVNGLALARAGIAAETPDPDGGVIERNDRRQPTGLLLDNAIERVSRLIPPLTTEQIAEQILAALRICARHGLTQVHDAGVDATTLAAYDLLAARRKMPIRVWLMWAGDEEAARLAAPRPGPRDDSGLLTLGGMKVYADGALGSRGAHLLEPYQDRPDWRGIPTITPDRFQRVARWCLEHHWQLCTHAIGDAANRMILDQLEVLGKENPELARRRFRIEHVQVLTARDMARFAPLGVVASVQPTHCTSDMPWAGERLGPARARLAYIWQGLLNSGARLALGTDFPIEKPDPLATFYAAVTRMDAQGQPPGGWNPQEKLSRTDALRAMTQGVAWACFQEDDAGTLEPGKRADITILDRDILTVPEAEILRSRVRATLTGGRIVYEDPARR